MDLSRPTVSNLGATAAARRERRVAPARGPVLRRESRSARASDRSPPPIRCSASRARNHSARERAVRRRRSAASSHWYYARGGEASRYVGGRAKPPCRPAAGRVCRGVRGSARRSGCSAGSTPVSSVHGGGRPTLPRTCRSTTRSPGGRPERASCSCGSDGGSRSGRRGRRRTGAIHPGRRRTFHRSFRARSHATTGGASAAPDRSSCGRSPSGSRPSASSRASGWINARPGTSPSRRPPPSEASPGTREVRRDAYRVYAVEPALRPADAERAAAAGFTPPSGFRVDYSARPADLSEL